MAAEEDHILRREAAIISNAYVALVLNSAVVLIDSTIHGSMHVPTLGHGLGRRLCDLYPGIFSWSLTEIDFKLTLLIMTALSLSIKPFIRCHSQDIPDSDVGSQPRAGFNLNSSTASPNLTTWSNCLPRRSRTDARSNGKGV